MLVEGQEACTAYPSERDQSRFDWEVSEGSLEKRGCWAILTTPPTEQTIPVVVSGHFDNLFNVLTVTVRPSSATAYHYVLDVSNRMDEAINGESVFDAARGRINETAETYVPDALLGLRVFGLDIAEGECADLTVGEIRPREQRRSLPMIVQRLDALIPSQSDRTQHHLSEAVTEAVSTDLSPELRQAGRATVIVVTSGGEGCSSQSLEREAEELEARLDNLLAEGVDLEFVLVGAGPRSLRDDEAVQALLDIFERRIEEVIEEGMPQGELRGQVRYVLVEGADAEALADEWEEVVEALHQQP
ncbi:MAG: hypothetical protein ACLFWH_06445 [Actinomycetota bacterium]